MDIDALPTADDYAGANLALLPNGRAWAKDPGSVLSRLASWLAPTFSRLAGRAAYLLTESPAGGQLLEMLPDWESSLGLPNACSGPQLTIALRVAAVRAQLAARGGQSVPYFVAYAAALGYTITITEFAPARCDIAGADDPVYEPEWTFVWQVNVSAQEVSYAAADISYADEPLLTTSGRALECELQRVAPAHTVLLFNYDVDPAAIAPAPLDQFVLDQNTLA